VGAYSWLKLNDLPNWVVVIFTVILWPLFLFWWNRHKVNNIPNLRVSFAEGHLEIRGKPHRGVDIVFFNNTGSVAYLNRVRIRSCSALFPVPTDVDRDIAENSHDLSFMNCRGKYADREVTLQTSQSTKTIIAVAQEMPQAFYNYAPDRPWLIPRPIRRRRYFVLEYTAMVGEKKYSVMTKY
jgi:hypothetical protein